MNTKLLKAESHKLSVAYLCFFFQAPYAYLNKWVYQLLYWLCAMAFLSATLTLSGVIDDTETEIADIVVMLILSTIFIAWAIQVFFALPNMVKKENLKLYEIMSSKKQKK